MRIHSMISRKASRGSVAGAALLTVLLGLAMSANTQAVVPSAFSPGPQFAEKSGEELFTMVCQSCHMPDGKGAAGAGAYPPLADNKNLVTSGYPIATVLNGQRAMPRGFHRRSHGVHGPERLGHATLPCKAAATSA